MTAFELMWRRPDHLGRLLGELINEAGSVDGDARLRKRVESTERHDVRELLVALVHREAVRAKIARLEDHWPEIDR